VAVESAAGIRLLQREEAGKRKGKMTGTGSRARIIDAVCNGFIEDASPANVVIRAKALVTVLIHSYQDVGSGSRSVRLPGLFSVERGMKRTGQ